MLSTIPPSLLSFCWSWWWDSNSQPIDYKSIALPLRHISKYNPNIRHWLVAVPVLLSGTSFLLLPVYIPPLAHQTAIFVVGFEKESHVMYCQLPQYEARLWTGGDSGGAWSRKLRLERAATLSVRPQSHIIQTYPTWASLTPPPILSVPRLCLILKVRPGLLREHC